MPVWVAAVAGSSPHGRGGWKIKNGFHRTLGFIPARAGRISNHGRDPNKGQGSSPHGRGGSGVAVDITAEQGSSPHGRGGSRPRRR